MERNRRTTLQGVVTSDKMDKTIVVLIETHKKHPKYAKRVKYRKKYYAHDETNQAGVGDTVTIMQCRPLSATKRFRLVSVDKKAVASIKASEAELSLKEEEVKEVLSQKEVKVEEKAAEVPQTEAEVTKEEEPKATKAKAKTIKAKEEKVEDKAEEKPAKKTSTKKTTKAKKEEE